MFSAIVADDQWKQYLLSVANDKNFLLGADAKAFLANENRNMKALLGALHLATFASVTSIAEPKANPDAEHPR